MLNETGTSVGGSDPSSLAGTSQPAAGKHAEQIASRRASSDQLLADLGRAAAAEQAVEARLDELERERDAAYQQIEQLQLELATVAQQEASEGDHGSQPQARPDSPNPITSEETAAEVPLIDLRLLEGVFSRDERRQLAQGLIKTVVGVKGEFFRDQTDVLIAEVPARNRDTPQRADTPH